MEHQCKCADFEDPEDLEALEALEATDKITISKGKIAALVGKATKAERKRLLRLHLLCRDSAVPGLFRSLATEGYTPENAADRIAQVFKDRT